MERFDTYWKKNFKRSKNRGMVNEKDTFAIINGKLEVEAIDEYVDKFALEDRTGRFWRKLLVKGDGSIYGSMNVIGKHTFNKIPSKIAEALKLPNPELFTGQAFRGTALGIAAGKGANEQQLKQISGHTSVTALHVYIANNKISKENSANFTSVSGEASKSIPCKQQQSSSAIHGGGAHITNIVNVYGNYNIDQRKYDNIMAAENANL